MSAANPNPRAPWIPMKEKLKAICSLIQSYKLTPKSFLVAFLEQKIDNVAFRRRLWGTDKGWDSTEEVLLTIKKRACVHNEGRALWEEFILSQVIFIFPSSFPSINSSSSTASRHKRLFVIRNHQAGLTLKEKLAQLPAVD